MGLEKLHPFDSRKYEKIYNALIKSQRVSAKQFIQPTECKENTLKLVHPDSYLKTLEDSAVVARLVEVPPVSMLHYSIVQRYLLSPMRYATQGSLIAAEKAYLEYGWSMNLSGGYHHASAEKGGGFCIYADISLNVVNLINKYGHDGTHRQQNTDKEPLERIMILDLDAHQGNGYETDKVDQIFASTGADVFIADFYNERIYPHADSAKKGIDLNMTFNSHVQDDDYLDELQENLPKALDEFKPQLLIYNAGTDILIGDRLGCMDISQDGVVKRDYIVFDECFKRKIPIVMLLSGGYQESNAGVIAASILNLDDKFQLFASPNKLRADDVDDANLNDDQIVDDEKYEEEAQEKVEDGKEIK